MKQLNNIAEEYHVSIVSNEPCEMCLRGKQSKLLFHSNLMRVAELLELIYTDLCRPMDHSRYTTVYILKSKDESAGGF